jgi:hypothetical protein
VIVRRFVFADIAPIDRLGGQRQVANAICDIGIDLLSIGELLVHERDARKSHLQACAKPILRQITFDAITLDAFRIQNQNRWCPDCLEPFEVRGMFFDVGFERNERRVNEVRDLLIGVRLGFQPSTCASGRRRREIDQ